MRAGGLGLVGGEKGGEGGVHSMMNGNEVRGGGGGGVALLANGGGSSF